MVIGFRSICLGEGKALTMKGMQEILWCLGQFLVLVLGWVQVCKHI